MFRSGAPPRLVALLERLLAQEPAALSPPGPELEETLSALPTEAMGRWGGLRPSAVPSVPVPALVAEKAYQPRRWRRQEIAIIFSLATVIVGTLKPGARPPRW